VNWAIAHQNAVNVQSQESLTDRWKRWFEKVDELSVSTYEPQNEYQQR